MLNPAEGHKSCTLRLHLFATLISKHDKAKELFCMLKLQHVSCQSSSWHAFELTLSQTIPRHGLGLTRAMDHSH